MIHFAQDDGYKLNDYDYDYDYDCSDNDNDNGNGNSNSSDDSNSRSPSGMTARRGSATATTGSITKCNCDRSGWVV